MTAQRRTREPAHPGSLLREAVLPAMDVSIAQAEIASEDEFERLADRIAKRFKSKGITRSDVEDAIKWARRKS